MYQISNERSITMKKALKLTILALLIASMVLATGCSSKKFAQQEDIVDMPDTEEQEVQEEKVDKDVEIEIWGWFSFGGAIKQFEAQNGIKVKERIISFADCKQEYMEALANGTGPDVLIFDSSFFGQYTVDDVLENLLQEPYDAAKYRDKIIGWESGFSLDNKKLLSISYSTAPFITMYRADIMKENGFPYEPEEFSKFIENPENLMEIGKKLRQQGKYIFQYPTDVSDIAGATMGHFDDKLNYIRGGEIFAKTLDMAQEIYDSEMILNRNFWFDNGIKSIKEDKLVMLFLASYAMDRLETMVPEQKGKWRVAKAPLGLAAWATDTRLSINGQSKHKKEAWKLIEHIVTTIGVIGNVVPSYIPATENEDYLSQQKEYFGGQKIYPLLVETARNMKQYKLTPLDEEAHQLYIQGVWDSFYLDENSYADIERIRKTIEKETAEEKETLLE